MADTVTTNKLLISLLTGFTEEQKTEILLNISDIGLSERDFEILQLLRIFHLLKAYIETLPESVKESVDAIKKSEASIDDITDTLNVVAQSFQTMVDKMEAHIKEAGKKTMAVVTDEMNEYGDQLKASLKDAINEALPLSNLKKASKTFSRVVSENAQISEELRKNAFAGKKIQYGLFAGVWLIAFFSAWAFLHFRYEARIAENRISVAQQIEHNQDVLHELSKANRRMELQYGENGEIRLAISNAEGYTSPRKSGVIQLK